MLYSRVLYRHKILLVTLLAGPGLANFVSAAGKLYVNNISIFFCSADTLLSRVPDPVC